MRNRGAPRKVQRQSVSKSNNGFQQALSGCCVDNGYQQHKSGRLVTSKEGVTLVRMVTVISRGRRETWLVPGNRSRYRLELTSGCEKARFQIMTSGLPPKHQVDLNMVTRRDGVGGGRSEAMGVSSDMLLSHLGIPTAQRH